MGLSKMCACTKSDLPTGSPVAPYTPRSLKPYIFSPRYPLSLPAGESASHSHLDAFGTFGRDVDIETPMDYRNRFSIGWDMDGSDFAFVLRIE